MKEKLFYWISFGFALTTTVVMFIISVINNWLIIEICCGIFALILSYIFKVILKKTRGNHGKSRVVYNREKDGELY